MISQKFKAEYCLYWRDNTWNIHWGCLNVLGRGGYKVLLRLQRSEIT